MTVYLGADHGGFALKEAMKQWLQENHFTVEDCGATQLDPDDDYPEYSFAVAQKVAQGPANEVAGILFCRSGQGMTIAANKVHGIRAVLAPDILSIREARRDNNANVMSLAADHVQEDQAKELIHTFLMTPFSQAERHIRRIQKIQAQENASTSNV